MALRVLVPPRPGAGSMFLWELDDRDGRLQRGGLDRLAAAASTPADAGGLFELIEAFREALRDFLSPVSVPAPERRPSSGPASERRPSSGPQRGAAHAAPSRQAPVVDEDDDDEDDDDFVDFDDDDGDDDDDDDGDDDDDDDEDEQEDDDDKAGGGARAWASAPAVGHGKGVGTGAAESRAPARDGAAGGRNRVPPSDTPVFSSGEPFEDRRSVFQAHVAAVHSVAEAQAGIAWLKEDKKIGRATHNIVAYRITAGGRILQDNDDDGETAAGSRLAHLLEVLGVENVVVVVSRWYGGIQLGPDRFKHINSVARKALEAAGFLGASAGAPTGSAAGARKPPSRSGKKR